MLATRQSVNQRRSVADTELLENFMNVQLYGSFAQAQPARYFFVSEAAADQSCDLLFAVGQTAMVNLPGCEFGFYVANPARPQRGHAIDELFNFFGCVLWPFHRRADGKRTRAEPQAFNSEQDKAQRSSESNLNRDSPDDSQADVNIRAFLALLQD
jgi:hypothetical protein